jgi:subtilase family serine protease
MALSLLTFAGTAAAAQAATPHVARQMGQSGSAHRTMRAALGPYSIFPGSKLRSVQLCRRPNSPQHAGCFATAEPAALRPNGSQSVWGITPADLSRLYAYPGPGNQGRLGSGQTVAVVEAGHYAYAEYDLNVYRRYFNLPPCTTEDGCLSKVGAAAAGQSWQLGAPTSVSANPTTPDAIGWAAETDIDMQAISAVCPNCHIMVAEAASDSIDDLTSAVSAAMAAGANIVNASFGTPEASYDWKFIPVYENGRVRVVAASGDWGYGVYYPASDTATIAVAGTSLHLSGNQVDETLWSGSGSGCSQYFSKGAWQPSNAVAGGCLNRKVADVAAVADPNDGVAVFDSTLNGWSGGWTVAGGTSVAAPIITGMFALSGHTEVQSGAAPLYEAPASAFLSVTSGSNGSCWPSYLCTAGSGVYGPAGVGVPQGLGGF